MPRPGLTSSQRGYGADHRRRRAEWAPLVQAGTVDCWRCSQPLDPDQPWDLGHDDHDRTLYRGPEHALRTGPCIGNRAAGAAKGGHLKGQGSTPQPRQHGEPLDADEW